MAIVDATLLRECPVGPGISWTRQDKTRVESNLKSLNEDASNKSSNGIQHGGGRERHEEGSLRCFLANAQSITTFYDGARATHFWGPGKEPWVQFAGVGWYPFSCARQRFRQWARVAFGICFSRYLDRNLSLWHRSEVMFWAFLKSNATSLSLSLISEADLCIILVFLGCVTSTIVYSETFGIYWNEWKFV